MGVTKKSRSKKEYVQLVIGQRRMIKGVMYEARDSKGDPIDYEVTTEEADFLLSQVNDRDVPVFRSLRQKPKSAARPVDLNGQNSTKTNAKLAERGKITKGKKRKLPKAAIDTDGANKATEEDKVGSVNV